MDIPTAVKIDGYGTALVTDLPDEDDTGHGIVAATFENLRRDAGPPTNDGTRQTWRLDMYADEALAFAEALIHHARQAMSR